MKPLFVGLKVLILLMTASVMFAAEPIVENVSFQQRTDGSRILDVTYDVFDADEDTLTVALQLSADGGLTWGLPVLNPQGDVGHGVLSGSNKMISYDLSGLSQILDLEGVVARVIASDTGVYFSSHQRGVTAAMHLATADWQSSAILDSFSRADLLIITGSELWKGSSSADFPVVEELKRRNPEQIIVGYVSGFSAKLRGEDPGSSPFWHDWFNRTRPYWVYTTEGDTAQTWPNNVVVNILNPDCRAVMVETIVEYQTESFNRLDGIYWDYFNDKLWSYGVDMHGDIDMDGDGIGHADDPDEMQAYRDAQEALVQAFRDSLPDDLQIFNGQRAYEDSAFAGLADGIMYEIFPTLFFPDPDMATALDPDYPNNLFQVRTWLRESERGPFIIFSNPWQNYLFVPGDDEPYLIPTGNQFRAVALMMDGYACWNSHDGDTFSYTFGWPSQNIVLGPPLGPAVIEGDFLRRSFQFGEVEIEMKSGVYPNPFDYRIYCLGILAEELALPSHYP